MTTDRPYRQAMSEQDARSELSRCASTQFDPAVVDAFIAELTSARERMVDDRCTPDPAAVVQ